MSGSATRAVQVDCPAGDTGTWSSSDIGQPPLSGSPWFEGAPDTGDLHICTAGKRIGSNSDECLFLYKEIAGDFRITARIASAEHIGSGSAAGVMVRESLDEGAITAEMNLSGPLTASPRRARFGYRLEGGATMVSQTADMGSGEAPVWVRLERRGETLSAFYSLDGDAWPPCGEPAVFTGLPETVLAGVAACKGTATAASGPQALQAVITNLEIVPLEPPKPLFLRGNANADATTDISDAVTILGFLFLGGTMNDCREAADVNDDGKVDISDPVSLLGHLFLGGVAPPEPYAACGVDPPADNHTAGALGCNMFAKCP
jgi:regulation of enolase protein 1 (concanavalin A-like superfamily)